MFGKLSVLTFMFLFCGISLAIDIDPNVLLDNCLLKKQPKACKEIARAYFIVDTTGRHVGYNVSLEDAFIFFITLSCKYGDDEACISAVVYSYGRVGGFIKVVLFLEEKKKINPAKDERTLSMATYYFKSGRYIYSTACSSERARFVSSTFKEAYARACSGLYESLKELENFMEEKLGFTKEEIIKLKFVDKFPLPKHMKHLSIYE